MSKAIKNEEVDFNVEDDVIDSEELRAEDYNKYRELYKLIAEINQLPNDYHPRKMEALKELMDNKLYLDAVKSPFFLDKLAESIEEGGFGYEMTETLEVDLKLYLQSDDPKYANLKQAISDAHVYHSYRDEEGLTLTTKRKKIFIYAAIGLPLMFLFSTVGIGRVLAFFNVRSLVLLIMSVAGAVSIVAMLVRTILYFVNKRK